MRDLEFDICGFEDLACWVENDRKKVLKIIQLIKSTQKEPFQGIGKIEPLKHNLSGCWSRRIDQEYRLVYQVFEHKITVLACRFHYN